MRPYYPMKLDGYFMNVAGISAFITGLMDLVGNIANNLGYMA